MFRLFGIETALAAVNARLVDEYVATRTDEGASRHTIYKELVTLRGTLKVAKRRGEFSGDIQAVMLDGFSTGYKPRERKLTAEEADRLLAELPSHRAAHVAFMIATGARWSESVRAMRGDIDWDRGLVRLRGTKTSAAKRAVPIAGFSIELLRFVERHATGDNGKLFQRWTNRHRALTTAHARAQMRSRAMQLDGTHQEFDALSASEKCIQLKQSVISPNDLRRTYATWLGELGIEPHLVAPALGHRDLRMVERVYGRLAPEVLAATFRKRFDPLKSPVVHDDTVSQSSEPKSRPATSYND